MNRLHKFLNKKNSKFFKCFKDIYDSSEAERFEQSDIRLNSLNFYLYYVNENYKNTFDLLQIKRRTCNNIQYSIVKDFFTDTWFFICKQLVVFYIHPRDFEDFYLTFLFSSEYKMEIYKTETYYIVFCISHTSDDIADINRFLLYNNSDIRYIILSNIIKDQTIQKDANQEDLNALVNSLQDSPVTPVFIGAATQEEIGAYLAKNNWKIQGLQADATVVKTIMRSNPGIMILKDGLVMAKYHHNNTPEAGEVLDFFIK